MIKPILDNEFKPAIIEIRKYNEEIDLQKITKEQYERAIQIIDKKNMYGLNK